MPVSTKPGDSTLTRTGNSSVASPRAKPSIVALTELIKAV